MNDLKHNWRRTIRLKRSLTLAAATLGALAISAAPAQAGLADGLLDKQRNKPPQHGKNPHGQGTVGSVDIAPSQNPSPGGSGPIGQPGEEVVVGQSRAEQNEDGSYSADSRNAGALGIDIAGSHADEGESANGPLEAVQSGLLDPLCGETGDGICVEVLRSDAEASDDGAKSSTAAADVSVGGEDGVGATVAESNAEIEEDENGCQDSRSDATAANASAGGNELVEAFHSETDTNQCGAPGPGPGPDSEPERDSGVVEVLGTEVVCDDSGDLILLSPAAEASCNNDAADSDSASRDALDVFVLKGGNTSLVKVGLGQSEAKR